MSGNRAPAIIAAEMAAELSDESDESVIADVRHKLIEDVNFAAARRQAEQESTVARPYTWARRSAPNPPEKALQSGRFRTRASSPMTPRRNVRTQRTKMAPCTTITQPPSWAR